MNNKKYLVIGVSLAILILIVVLFSVSKKADEPDMAGSKSPVINSLATDTPAEDVNNVPNEPSATDSMPLSTETKLTVDGNTFSPKTIKAKFGEKVFITLSAQDDARHTFNFIDKDLSFILVLFNKADGDRSITFPAPAAGTYTYYVDDKTNTGTFIVE